MDCPHCNRATDRCTHAKLHQEIQRLQGLVAAFEVSTQKIAEPKVIMVRSLVSHRTQKPRIDIQLDQLHTQMDADSAMDLAKNLIECSAGAYADAFLFHFITEKLEQPPAAGGQILMEFRDFRDALAEEFKALDKEGPTSGKEPLK